MDVKIEEDGAPLRPAPTGDYAADTAAGQTWARKMLADEPVTGIIWTMRGFGKDPARAAIETGFFTLLISVAAHPFVNRSS